MPPPSRCLPRPPPRRRRAHRLEARPPRTQHPHVLGVVDELTSRGVGFRTLTEGLHTDGPMGTAMLTIMAAFAQLERDTMIERTRAGLAAAEPTTQRWTPRKVDDADAAKARRSGRRASRPPTSPRCWESPAPPCTATSPRTAQPRTSRAAALLNADHGRAWPGGSGQWETAATICATLGMARPPSTATWPRATATDSSAGFRHSGCATTVVQAALHNTTLSAFAGHGGVSRGVICLPTPR